MTTTERDAQLKAPTPLAEQAQWGEDAVTGGDSGIGSHLSVNVVSQKGDAR